MLEAEMPGAAFREGADSIGFGGVMATKVEVEPLFLGEGEMFLTEFPGDEGIGTGLLEDRQGAASGTGEDGDTFRIFGSILDGGDGLPEFVKQPGFQVAAVGRRLGEEGDGGSLMGKKPVHGIEAEGLGEEAVVAEFLMSVEGEVGTVEGEVVGNGEAEFPVKGAGVAPGRVPHHAMMDHEEVDALSGGLPEGDESGVDGRSNFGDVAVVLELKTIVGAGEIGHCAPVCEGIAKGDCFG